MTTNAECVVSILATHRDARMWTDEAVADDILRQLDLDPTAEAKNATPAALPGITEDEVIAHEAAAKEAVDKAKAARKALDDQKAEHKAEREADIKRRSKTEAEPSKDGPAKPAQPARAQPMQAVGVRPAQPSS